MEQQFLVFITVVEKQNFSRTAEALHMTQPAVSQYIKTLEQSLGTKLLDRSNKYVRLNKAGEIVYHHAKQMVGIYTKMEGLIDDLLNIGKGELSIGSSYTFGEYILPHIIAYLREEFPLIKPNITIGNTAHIADLILTHQLDVGIIEGQFEDSRLVVEPFSEDDMYIIVASNHSLANRESISLENLKDVTWIVREKGSGTREATEKMFTDFNLQPSNLMEFGSIQIIKESVEAGLGVTLLSDWAVRREVSLGHLKLLNIKGHPIKREFSILKLNNEFYTKATELFLKLLKSKSLSEFK